MNVCPKCLDKKAIFYQSKGKTKSFPCPRCACLPDIIKEVIKIIEEEHDICKETSHRIIKKIKEIK